MDEAEKARAAAQEAAAQMLKAHTSAAAAEAFTTEARTVREIARRHHAAPSSWHGLRHAYVSALVTAGLDPVHVAMAAGHSDPAFTLRTYAHPATDASTRIRAAQSHVEVD